MIETKEKNNLIILSIVAIVAIVGIVSVFGIISKGNKYASSQDYETFDAGFEEDLVGEAAKVYNTCKDSDNGINYFLKGTTKVCSKSCKSKSDSCKGKVLTEYYCKGTNFGYEYYNCPDGCSNGACIKIKPPVNATQPSPIDDFKKMINSMKKGMSNVDSVPNDFQGLG